MELKHEIAIMLLGLLLIFFLSAFVINEFTGRTFNDGIIEAETHHILTGKYHNTYEILDSSRAYILLLNEADFKTTYWNSKTKIFEE